MPIHLKGKIDFIGHLGSNSLLKNLLTREKILPTFQAFREFIDKQGECDGVEKNIAFLIQKIIVHRISNIRVDENYGQFIIPRWFYILHCAEVTIVNFTAIIN